MAVSLCRKTDRGGDYKKFSWLFLVWIQGLRSYPIDLLEFEQPAREVFGFGLQFSVRVSTFWIRPGVWVGPREFSAALDHGVWEFARVSLEGWRKSYG